MISAELAALVGGFLFILFASVSKEERTQVTLGVLGIAGIFWGLGLFGFGRVFEGMLPAVTLMFGCFSFYSKGNAQLISVIITTVLFFQLFYIM
jgi:hypothetical protein